jgi:hypothetical protein
MSETRRLSDRIQDPEFLEGMTEKAIDELRSMRELCREAETELSFERRLCQARIDILSAELDRREGGSDDSLLSQLPEILAEEAGGRRGEGLPARAPDFSIPRNADIPRRRVEEIVGEQMLTRLPQLPPEEIRRVLGDLAEYERKVSTRRKAVQDVMDSVQAEIVRRYSSGEADPAKVLG